MDRHKAATRTPGQDWHKAEIKAALEMAGWSFRSLAKHHDLSPTAIRQAVKSRYPAAEQRIADALGLRAMDIWPSRYNKNGTPNSQRGNPNWVTGRASDGKRSTGAAAVNVKTARPR